MSTLYTLDFWGWLADEYGSLIFSKGLSGALQFLQSWLSLYGYQHRLELSIWTLSIFYALLIMLKTWHLDSPQHRMFEGGLYFFGVHTKSSSSIPGLSSTPFVNERWNWSYVLSMKLDRDFYLFDVTPRNQLHQFFLRVSMQTKGWVVNSATWPELPAWVTRLLVTNVDGVLVRSSSWDFKNPFSKSLFLKFITKLVTYRRRSLSVWFKALNTVYCRSRAHNYY